jgi:RNA polymerase sigma-32 factor
MQTWSSVKMGTTAAQRRLFFNLRKTKQKIAALEDEAELTPEIIKKLAEKLCVKESEIIQMNTRMAGQDLSLNAPMGDESGETSEWQDWLVDERENHEIEIMHHDEMSKRRDLLNKALDGLMPREREIFYMRRLADPPLSLEQVATKMNLSRERVRQIELAVFGKVQKSIKLHARPLAHHI